VHDLALGLYISDHQSIYFHLLLRLRKLNSACFASKWSIMNYSVCSSSAGTAMCSSRLLLDTHVSLVVVVPVCSLSAAITLRDRSPEI